MSEQNDKELKKQWISKIVQMQLKGENFNSPQNSDGWTILMCATKEVDYSIMQMILNVKDARGNRLININAKDKNGKTALVIAAQTGDNKKIILLLRNDADLNLAKNAVSKKVYKKLKDLYQQVQNASKEFIMCILTGDNEKAKLILENEPVNVNAKIKITIGPDSSDCLAIVPAANDNNVEMMELLLKQPNIDINKQGEFGFTALRCASLIGSKKIVQMLLNHPNIDVNIPDIDGATALICATDDNYIEIFKMLLDHPNIDVNVQTNIGNSALIYAAQHCHKKVLKLLLNHPNIKVNLQDDQGFTALITAISEFNGTEDHKEIIKLLLNHPKVDVNIKDMNGTPALIYAMRKDNREIVELLLKHPKIDVNLPTNNGANALTHAAQICHIGMMKLLLSHPKIDVNHQDNKGCTALISAASDTTETEENHIILLKLLLQHPKIDVNIKDNEGTSALMCATRNDHTERVKLLLKHPNIDVNSVWDNKYKFTPLILAVQEEHVEISKLLLKHPKIDVNRQNQFGNTAILLAVHHGPIEIVKLLLENPKIDINIQDNKGFTALIFAAFFGRKEAFELLMKNPKKRLNIESKIGLNVLNAAAYGNNIDILKILLESGEIDINTENRYRDTVLIYALSRNNKEMVELLLKQPNIDVNLQESTGYSPLMYVCMEGQKDMAKLLLKHPKIDINEHNEKRSALTEAVINGQEEIVKLLLKRGADVNIQYLNGYTVLMSAVESGYAKIVELLLDQPHIDLTIENDEGETALQCTERTYRISMARLIRAKMESLSQPSEQTFAKNSIKYSNRTEEEIVEKFLQAVSDGDINEMDLLIEETNPMNGETIIPIDARNKEGNTALVIASKNGNLEVVKWLISYMKDEKVFKTLEGGMALITAAKEGHFDVVEELLNQKINVNSTDGSNRTALHYATENHYLRIIKLLIKKGAKVMTKDKYDKTALDIISEQIEKLNNAKNKKDKTFEYHHYEIIKATLEKESQQLYVLSNDQRKDHSEIEIDEFSLSKWEAVPSDKYEKQLKFWEKNEPTTFNKIHQLIEMVKVDPFRGLGRVERLTADLEGLYSRKIDKNNRLIYEVDGEKVHLLSCKGHYQLEKRKNNNNRIRTK